MGPPPRRRARTRGRGVSIISNTLLIALKVVAGIVTGSIAILTEAAHSAIDLVASVIAFFSVRKADQPADESHPYGHDKVENVAAGIEGMLILVGAGVIVFESVRRLTEGAEVESLGFGIAVIGFSAVANLGVSTYLYRQARATESPALEGDAAHLRTDAFTSIGVLVGLVLVELTGVDLDRPAGRADRGGGDRVRGRADPDADQPGAGGRGAARGRDERGRGRPWRVTEPRSWSAFTSCARGAPEAGATSTSTSSSATAPACAAPTRSRHELQRAIALAAARRRRSHPPRARGGGGRAQAGGAPVGQNRLTAAAAPTASRTPE